MRRNTEAAPVAVRVLLVGQTFESRKIAACERAPAKKCNIAWPSGSIVPRERRVAALRLERLTVHGGEQQLDLCR
jgi:hypothetical protein